MADATTTLDALKEPVRRFNAERRWEPYYSPKNLAMGLACEAAELMEHFLWVDAPASNEVGRDPARREDIADEVADIFCYLLNLSDALGIDLSDALRAKLVKNARKYPAPASATEPEREAGR